LRDDIVARLGAAPIHLPPLRSRVEDSGVLLAHFFLLANPEPKLEQPACRRCACTCPLNVRELKKNRATRRS